MIQHKDHFHGSDLEKIEKAYGIKKEEIVSFSANVNPLGISPLLREGLSSHLDAIQSYPDRDYKDLRSAIAAYCNTEASRVIVGNGTTELISLFIQVIQPKRTLILGPTYSEYEREVSLAGGKTKYFPLSEENGFALDLSRFCEKLREDLDLLILCNPNNPTSTTIPRKDMRKIMDVCKENNIFVLIDETYIEFVENIADSSAIPLTSYYNNLIILRGTSKFFAAPGLRLGYALTDDDALLSEINRNKNPWMINSLAEIAGKLMFSDAEYIKKTRELISSERKRLFEAFSASERFMPYLPTANFMLIKILDPDVNSGLLFDKAIREKLMIRDCSTFPFLNDRFIRICFMAPEDNDRLLKCLL